MDKFRASESLSSEASENIECVVFLHCPKDINKLDVGVAIKHQFPFISAVGISASKKQLSKTLSLDCVKAVSGNALVKIAGNQDDLSDGIVKSVYPKLSALHTKGIDGRGVTAAVIDTGLAPHLDFVMPAYRAEFTDFVSDSIIPYDDNGHGTAVAGILGGNGLVSNGLYRGVAPRANIIALKAVNQKGEGGTFNILSAMQWVFNNHKKKNIKVLNMSFGTEPTLTVDPLKIGAEALWKSGVTVVCSAGNSGPDYKTIKSPATSANVITVGGAEHYPLGWNVAEFSSRGEKGIMLKPDIIAPGVNIITTACNKPYLSYSGTSMSAPIVSGVCALILQQYPTYTPDKVKEMIINGAQKLECAPFNCGRGMLSLTDLFS